MLSRVIAWRGASIDTAIGVYVPAMMRKMFAWSKRRSMMAR